MAQEPGDRYEPFPGLTKVPGWLWKRMGRGARIGRGWPAAVLVVGVILLIPVLAEVARGQPRGPSGASARPRWPPTSSA